MDRHSSSGRRLRTEREGERSSPSSIPRDTTGNHVARMLPSVPITPSAERGRCQTQVRIVNLKPHTYKNIQKAQPFVKAPHTKSLKASAFLIPLKHLNSKKIISCQKLQQDKDTTQTNTQTDRQTTKYKDYYICLPLSQNYKALFNPGFHSFFMEL